MSGYGVYDWRAAEEARQRELARLRGECAALRDRRAALAKAARKAVESGATVTVPAELDVELTDRASMSSGTAAMTTALDKADRELTAAWDETYRTRTRASGSAPAHTTAAQEQAAAGTCLPDQASHDSMTVLNGLIGEGELRAHRAALRCEPEQLSDVRRQLDRLAAATTVPAAQACLTDLKVAAQRAAEQAKRTAVRAEALARLHVLLDEVEEPRGAALRRYVDSLPDPAEPAVAATIMAEIDRQNHVRARVRLAGVLTEVLTELRFSVGAGFATELAGAGERAVVALPGNPHYGLRMSFDVEGRLRTELVRADTVPPSADLAVEVVACRRLVDLLAAAGGRGVDISRAGPAAFGSRPPDPVDPALLGLLQTPEGRVTTRTKRQVTQRQRGVVPGADS